MNKKRVAGNSNGNSNKKKNDQHSYQTDDIPLKKFKFDKVIQVQSSVRNVQDFSRASARLTEEQLAVIKCNDMRIFVQAYAGSGKTSTLEEYCKVRPHEKILYVAFNKTVQESARERFGENVECRTFDSICFEMVKAKGKTMRNFDTQLVKDMCSGIGREAYRVFDILKRFFDDPNSMYVDEYVAKEDEMIQNFVIEFWNKALDGDSSWTCHLINRKIALVMNDGATAKKYLETRFNTILLDECQDINGIMLALVEKFSGRKIFIGDEHQAIYSFMGCVNAFKNAAESATFFKLSKSFRFGDKVAERADWIITMIKNPQSTVDTPLIGIKGTSPDNTIITEEPFDDKDKIPYTILARVNKTLFKVAYSCATSENKSIHWIGKEDFFKKITTFLGYFKSKSYWEKRKQDAEENNDIDVLAMMEMIEREGIIKLEMMMHSINKASTHETTAQVILSTVHKAKGLEWPRVYVCDDIGSYIKSAYYSFLNDEEKLSIYEEECNIYYVAVTRAMTELYDDTHTSIRSLLEERISDTSIQDDDDDDDDDKDESDENKEDSVINTQVPDKEQEDEDE